MGQGSFAVVKLKLFRGIQVAVKELQPRTLLADVKKEAYILAQLSHLDFGKATPIENDRKCRLSDSEKAEYAKKYPHIAPEVVSGLTSWTVSSDIYSAGRIMQYVLDQQCFDEIPTAKTEILQEVITKCQCMQYTERPSAKSILESFQKLTNLTNLCSL